MKAPTQWVQLAKELHQKDQEVTAVLSGQNISTRGLEIVQRSNDNTGLFHKRQDGTARDYAILGKSF